MIIIFYQLLKELINESSVSRTARQPFVKKQLIMRNEIEQ